MTLLSTSFQNNKVVISSPFPLLNHRNYHFFLCKSNWGKKAGRAEKPSKSMRNINTLMLQL